MYYVKLTLCWKNLCCYDSQKCFMDYFIGPEGLVQPLLIFGVILLILFTSKALPAQKWRMSYLAVCRAEMRTATAELRIAQALRSKVHEATRFSFDVCNNVCIFRETETRIIWSFEVRSWPRERDYSDWWGCRKTSWFSQLIPAVAPGNNRVLKRILTGNNRCMQQYLPRAFTRKYIDKSNPKSIERYLKDTIISETNSPKQG